MSHLGIKLLQRLFRGRINRQTKAVLAELNDGDIRFQKGAEAHLNRLAASAISPFDLGTTEWGFPLSLPLELLTNHSLVIGSSGAGKSYLALLLLTHALKLIETDQCFPMGILDAKGELAAKALQYIHAHLYNLPNEQRKKAVDKICVIDFAKADYVTPYNILSNAHISRELLVNNRIQTIGQIYGGTSGLTTRMRSLLKYMLLLLIEFQLPISFFEKLCLDQEFLQTLAGKSKNSRIRFYFAKRFPKESKSTVFGLAQRIESLFISKSVRLSMSASDAPDFQKLQDEGKFVIINVCEPDISRSVSEFLLRIILSDIQQSVFRRNETNKTYLWCLDEAQVLYKDKTSRENMNDLLTMSRSFGSYFMLLTQSLTSAVRDKDIINSILQNIRWAMVFRSTLRDAKIIAPAIPNTGDQSIVQPYSYGKLKTLTKEQVLNQELESVTHFPQRKGFLWLKSDLPYAMKIITRKLAKPEGFAGTDKDGLPQFVEQNPLTSGVPVNEIKQQLQVKSDELKELKTTKVGNVSPIMLETGKGSQAPTPLMDKLKNAYVNKAKHGQKHED